MIEQHLKFLVVEDSATDAALIQRQLLKCVENADIVISDKIIQTRHALKTFIPDIVFTDYQLVGFTGQDVVENVKELYPNVPIVVISGTLNSEELAANIIMQGASGFLLKNNINTLHKRLEPLIEKILEEKSRLFERLERERKERQELEEIHSLLKEAAKSDKQKDSTKEYYEKILAGISDKLKTIIK